MFPVCLCGNVQSGYEPPIPCRWLKDPRSRLSPSARPFRNPPLSIFLTALSHYLIPPEVNAFPPSIAPFSCLIGELVPFYSMPCRYVTWPIPVWRLSQFPLQAVYCFSPLPRCPPLSHDVPHCSDGRLAIYGHCDISTEWSNCGVTPLTLE